MSSDHSSRRGCVFRYQIIELAEVWIGIARSGSSFWMVLYREDGFTFESYAGDGLVIEVNLSDFRSGLLKAFFGSGETMIVCGYGNPVCLEVFDRLIATSMPEL